MKDSEALQALVGALLRREAADRDEQATPSERARRIGDEARIARDAEERLRHEAAVQEVLALHRDAAAAALDETERLIVRLRRRTSLEVAAAFDAYLAALRDAHAIGALDQPALDAAVAALVTAGETLEQAVAQIAP